MSEIVSLGSINVDRVANASTAELDALEDRYDWFPEPGQTVERSTIPEGFPDEADVVFHGGKGANQAAAAATCGAETLLVGQVGADGREFGVEQRLADAGVDVSGIETAESAPTGTAYVFVDPEGENRIIVRPGANSAIDWADVRNQYDRILDADCLLVQNEIPTEPIAKLFAALATEPERPTVVFDPAPTAGAATLLDHDVVDFVTPNESEYGVLQPELDAFDGVVVHKRGGDDLVVEGERSFSVSPPAVPVTDTTGAGDVLNGFFGARLAAGAPLPDALEVATTAASLATRERGARNGIPTLDAVREFSGANVHRA